MKKVMMMLAAAMVAGSAEFARADELCATATFDRNAIRLYADPLAYEVVRDGRVVAAKTPIGLSLCGDEGVPAPKGSLPTGSGDEGAPTPKGSLPTGSGDALVPASPVATTSKTTTGVSVATPVYKKASVDLSCAETYADFGTFGVRLVARKDGVAYRFETKTPGKITYERAAVTIPTAVTRCWFNRTNRFGHEETVPESCTVEELPSLVDAASSPRPSPKLVYLPFLYELASNGVVAVTESDVRDYPAWYLGDVKTTDAGVELSAKFEAWPKTTMREGGWGKPNDPRGMSTGGRWIRVTEHENYLVDAPAPRALPWRVFMLADSAAQLCEADIVFALATPQDPKADFSWVKPGKVAWDWWNAFDNIGDPEGCTTKTYERFIDFAAATGVEYVIFDEGWSAALDIWNYSPVVDVPYLIDYANKKGVGIILWMAWAQAYGEEEKVVRHFAELGAKGFKVDFIDRADARAAEFYVDFAKACAKYHMLVDYHGTIRPTGLHREYPNVLNYEAIHGLEQMKWGKADKDMPYNDVRAFYLRLTAGPMDYTPGAMLNFPYGKYTAGERCRFPGSVGTRAHQMALMSLYEAPLQMLSDSPTHYERNRECFDFMAKVPTVWADTRAIGGSPDSVAACAREAKDGAWYASGICDKTPRTFSFKTDFLGAGDWQAEIFRDTGDGAENPTHYIHETRPVKAGDTLTFKLAPGGGFTVRFARFIR